MRIIIIIIFCSYFIPIVRAQKSIKSYLNDSAVTFSIGIPLSPALENGVFVSSVNRYMITNIPDSIIVELVKIKNSEWIKLLSNSNSCYATTLLLYQITAKDATVFYAIENKVHWMKFQANKDIRYWRSFLRKKMVRIKKGE